MDIQKLEELTGKFCDNYCKYPCEIKDVEEFEKICSDCPMNEMFDLFPTPRKQSLTLSKIWMLTKCQSLFILHPIRYVLKIVLRTQVTDLSVNMVITLNPKVVSNV